MFTEVLIKENVAAYYLQNTHSVTKTAVEISGCHGSAAVSSRLGCVSVYGVQFLAFEGAYCLHNMGNCTHSDRLSHSGQFES